VIQATSESRDRWGVMQLDHERLDVYDLALEFLVLANGILEPKSLGRSSCENLDRPSFGASVRIGAARRATTAANLPAYIVEGPSF
jgi:hypothetical protein